MISWSSGRSWRLLAKLVNLYWIIDLRGWLRQYNTTVSLKKKQVAVRGQFIFFQALYYSYETVYNFDRQLMIKWTLTTDERITLFSFSYF